MVYAPRSMQGIETVENLRAYLEDELDQLAAENQEASDLYLVPATRAPDKPKSGLLKYADGTNWNPSIGEGPYIYRGGVWLPLFSGGGAPREVLIAARTYYVRTDGLDSNTGLVNTSGGAFLTIQHAIDVVGGLDLNGKLVTIKVGNGTYTGAIVVNRPWVGAGFVRISGDTTTPANVLIQVTSPTFAAVQVGGVTLGVQTNGCSLQIEGVKLKTITSGGLLWGFNTSFIEITGNMTFDVAAVGNHITLSGRSGLSCAGVSYSISGGANSHWQTAINCSLAVSLNTVTVSGTPAFPLGFANAIRNSSMNIPGITFAGGATGPRYKVSSNATIDSNGAGANYLPGDSAGVPTSGGLYL